MSFRPSRCPNTSSVCLVRADLLREARWEILFEQVGVVTLSDVGMAPKHIRPTSVHFSYDGRSVMVIVTYLTRPIRLTLPEGSRSNSLKLTAVEEGQIVHARRERERGGVTYNPSLQDRLSVP